MIAMRIPTLLVLSALVCLLVLPQIATAQQSSLKFTVPAGWIEEQRTSSMRVAQYKLPKAATDTEDASLVLYYFGPGQGGSTAANMERWIGQMKQEDGSASKDKAKEENIRGQRIEGSDSGCVRDLRCRDCTRKRRVPQQARLPSARRGGGNSKRVLFFETGRARENRSALE